MLGRGKAARLQDGDYERLAYKLGVEPAALVAIALVESGKSAWFKDGRIKILWEPHIFYKYVPKSKRQLAVSKRLARAKWSRNYSDQKSASQRYRKLAQAIEINRRAAFLSFSSGMFQIMGFNHRVCGYATAEAMFNDFVDSERAQLEAFGAFLKSNGIVAAIKRQDWRTVARKYNGTGQVRTYSGRFKRQYNKLKKRRWLTPEQVAVIDKKQSRPDPRIIENRKRIEAERKAEAQKPAKSKSPLFAALANFLASIFKRK